MPSSILVNLAQDALGAGDLFQLKTPAAFNSVFEHVTYLHFAHDMMLGPVQPATELVQAVHVQIVPRGVIHI